jgi:hypothetical protein
MLEQGLPYGPALWRQSIEQAELKVAQNVAQRLAAVRRKFFSKDQLRSSKGRADP